MGILHQLLAVGHIPLKLKNEFSRRIGLRPDGCLRVIMYHDIAPHEMKGFASQIRWLSKSWRFIPPELFESMIHCQESIRGRNLLVTFDDGFASQKEAAETILDPLGIKALFFIPTDFIDLDDPEKQRIFMGRHLWPGKAPITFAQHLRSMNWDDLSYLLEDGHSIGAHTKSHARLSELKLETEMVEEIIGSGDRLESKLGASVKHFAIPWGNLASISPAALEIILRRFPFVYSAMKGDNANGSPAWAIRRNGMYPSNSLSLVGSVLEGGADFRYGKDLATLESWGLGVK